MQTTPAPGEPRDPSQLAGSWPLVGRSEMLDQIRRSIMGPTRRSAVLVGEVGVGKSRLAHEIVVQAEAADMATARVSGKVASAAIPLGAFAPLLPAVGQGETGVVDDRADLLLRCAQSLRERAGGRPLLLYVDDAHLLDDVSATLVFQLANTSWATVLATVRARELAPDAITALWKDADAVRLEIESLPITTVSDALTAALGGAVDDATVATFARRAKGNMLFLRELVFGAIDAGALTNDGGIWRLGGELHPTARLVELIDARLAGLSDEERSVMELVSFGEPLKLEALELLSDPATAEGLERKGLLRSSLEQSTVSISLAHPLYGEVVRAHTPAIRTRNVVRDLADAFEEVKLDNPSDLIRVATWRLMTGAAAPDLMFKAAVAARWRFDFALAEQLVRAAIDMGAGFEAALLAAQLAALRGRSADAAEALARLSEQADNWRERGAVALSRLDNRVIYAGTIDEGLRIAEDAIRDLAGTPVADEIAARRLALILAHEGPGRAVELVGPLLERTTGRALVWACMPAAYSLGRVGRIEEALEASRRGYQAQIDLTAPLDWYPWMHRFYEAEALAHAGRFAEAEAQAVREYRTAVDSDSHEAQALFAWQLAKSVSDLGNVEESVRRTAMATAIYRELDRPAFVQFCLIYRTLALSVGRRHDEALAAMRLHDELPLTQNYFMGVDLEHARGWLSIAAGNLPSAAEQLIAGGQKGVLIGDLVGATACLHTAARIGHAKKVVAQLSELAEHMEGDLAPARSAHARALVGGRPDELENVSEAFESMGAMLLAAESSTDAAVAWRQHGEFRRSAVAERRAAWLKSRCRGAATPALQVVETRAQLTAAEWEAVQLAAAGHTNKSIAEQLVISVRTVENRLQHAYGKLGVSGRSELGSALEMLRGAQED